MGAAAVLVGFRQAVDRRPVTAQTDDYLVARVRAGDDVAFEAIYDRYARGVLAFCVHMLGSREAAEDALQLTFVSAYRALRDGDRKIALRPWLYTIARNRCLSELRSRFDTVDVDEVVVDRAFFDGLADQVQRREELREMVEDMQRLPADQRAALVLFELGDHSHNEIAEVLSVRREKVKALIFQARAALVRGRHARERPCAEIRGRLATLQGRVLPRSTMRAHIDRCPGCAAFEDEVGRQRAALALILPVALTGELKASVLGAALGGGGRVAAGAGAAGSGAVVAGGAAGGGAAGSGAVVAGGATAVGGATAAGGAGGAGVLTAGVGAGGLAGAGAAGAAVVAGAPVAVIASGLAAVGATGVVAKILTAAVIATGAAGAIHRGSYEPGPVLGPAIAEVISITSAGHAIAATTAVSGATIPAATPSAANTSTETSPAAAPSATDTATTAEPSGSGTASSATGAGATTAAAPSGCGTDSSATGAGATTAAPSGSSTDSSATGAGATTAAPSGSGTDSSATGAGATTAAPSGSGTVSPATGACATTTAVPSESRTASPATGAGATTAVPSESPTASPATGAGATTAVPSESPTASPATDGGATTAAPNDSTPATPATDASATTAAPNNSAPVPPNRPGRRLRPRARSDGCPSDGGRSRAYCRNQQLTPTGASIAPASSMPRAPADGFAGWR